MEEDDENNQSDHTVKIPMVSYVLKCVFLKRGLMSDSIVKSITKHHWLTANLGSNISKNIFLDSLQKNSVSPISNNTIKTIN